MHGILVQHKQNHIIMYCRAATVSKLEYKVFLKDEIRPNNVPTIMNKYGDTKLIRSANDKQKLNRIFEADNFTNIEESTGNLEHITCHQTKDAIAILNG